jgi:hypothetical protein
MRVEKMEIIVLCHTDKARGMQVFHPHNPKIAKSLIWDLLTGVDPHGRAFCVWVDVYHNDFNVTHRRIATMGELEKWYYGVTGIRHVIYYEDV